jgi:hypothetical protein
MSHILGEHSMTEATDAYGLQGRTMVDREGDKIGRQPVGDDVVVPLGKAHVKDAPSIEADGDARS